MASYPRLMVPFAAVIGAAAALSMASPVAAADAMRSAGEVAATFARATPPVVGGGASPRNVLRVSRHHRQDRNISRTGNRIDCSGAWCGRQFVLMIGIAY